MKIVASVYVDHIDSIPYPVGLVCERLTFCERIHIFGSDLETTFRLSGELSTHPLKSRISLRSIGVGISCPGDIREAQNACLELVRKNESFDFAVVIQADIWLGDRALRYIDSWCRPEFLGNAIMLPTDHVRIYVGAERTNFGCGILGRDSRSVFVEDGAYLDSYWTVARRHEDDAEIYCVDVGCFTPEMARKHLLQWGRISGKRELGVIAEAKTREDFIRAYLRRIRDYDRTDRPLTPISMEIPEHRMLVERLDVKNDYEQVLGMIRMERDLELGKKP